MNRSISKVASKFRPLHSSYGGSFLPWRFEILEPESDIVTTWQYIFLFISIIALFIDPLYFFLPILRAEDLCIQTDNDLVVTITLIRTVIDSFYLLHILLKFRTAFVSPNSKVFGRGELVMDPKEIAMHYLKGDLAIDLASALPLPQILIWLVIPATRTSRADQTNNPIALIVFIQFIPRLFLIFPLNQRIIKTTGVVAKTAWSGAVYNLLLYILASHMFGTTWYLLSIGRANRCLISACEREKLGNGNETLTRPCQLFFLDCAYKTNKDRVVWFENTSIWTYCDAKGNHGDDDDDDDDGGGGENPDHIDYGIFGKAVTKNVGASPFVAKYLFCLWWGLRNLTALGQDLKTSTYIVETVFCTILCTCSLVLLAVLIGNIQTYFKSMTKRLEEWRVIKNDTEKWMRHRQLPPDLQERVRNFVQYQWVATKGVNEKTILEDFPLDLRREIQRHLCLYLVRRVPFFSQMDDQLLDAICERLISSLSTQGTYIVREGDPVNEMLFIIRGHLESSTTNGGKAGFFNSITLGSGDFCGEELLTWALLPNSSLNLPSSTRTVRTLTEVEAFALQAEDLKFVAHQFKRLQSKTIQHAFRYYSHQWRTWGACYIQAAWRRHKKRKMAEELARQESLYYTQATSGENYYIYEHEDGSYKDREAERSLVPSNSRNLGTAVLARKFLKNTRGSKKVDPVASAGSSLKMKLFKPNEPDFNADPDV